MLVRLNADGKVTGSEIGGRHSRFAQKLRLSEPQGGFQTSSFFKTTMTMASAPFFGLVSPAMPSGSFSIVGIGNLQRMAASLAMDRIGVVAL